MAVLPLGQEIAVGLLRLGVETDPNDLYQEASHFMDDWDHGVIDDLAEALGVAA